MEIKWYGTATVSFSEEGRSVLFDPFLPMNRMLRTFSVEELASAENIMITHGHFDHLIDVPEIMKKSGAIIYCSEEVARTLRRDGVKEDRISPIGPGDQIEIGPFKICVLKGKHIVFDRKLVYKTFLNPRILIHFGNLRKMLREMDRYPEGRVLVYEVCVKGKKILHMGSLNMDQEELYPGEVDLMTIPFQGRSDIDDYAMQFVRMIKPKALYLHHFDDSFPPVSSTVDTRRFREAVKATFPDIAVIVPGHGQTVTL